MDSDDTDEHRVDEGTGRPHGENDTGVSTDGTNSRPADNSDDELRATAAEEVDQRIVDLLSWILDTETRAKIYVHLLANPASTSEEVAKGTGLYPSTVREALAELHTEDRVTRQKRASEGAGNNPYEYTAIQPSELVGGVVDQVQQELNTIFTLDRVLDRSTEGDDETIDGSEPVTITVDNDDEQEPTAPGDERTSESTDDDHDYNQNHDHNSSE